MDFKTQLLGELSRRNTDFVIHTIGSNEDHFCEIIWLILHEKEPVPSRAAWVADGVSLTYPEMIKPYLSALIQKLPSYQHPGTIRNVLKILTRYPIPHEEEGFLADFCFNSIIEAENPVAIKVHSMQILANLAQIYPELSIELCTIIEDQFDKNSAGFKSKGRKILQEFQQR